MNDQHRAALDYVAALTDAEMKDFIAEARNAQQTDRDFARQLFGDREKRAATRILFDR